MHTIRERTYLKSERKEIELRFSIDDAAWQQLQKSDEWDLFIEKLEKLQHREVTPKINFGGDMSHLAEYLMGHLEAAPETGDTH